MNDNIKEKAQALYPISENAECYTAFLQGALVAQQELIEKACEWISQSYTSGVLDWKNCDSIIEDFRKAMEK